MRCIFKSINLNSTPTWPCQLLLGEALQLSVACCNTFCCGSCCWRKKSPKLNGDLSKNHLQHLLAKRLHEICIKLTQSCLLCRPLTMSYRAIPCHTMPYPPIQVFQIFFIKFNEEIVCALWLVWLDLCVGVACFPHLFKDAIEMETPTRGLHNLSCCAGEKISHRDRERE